MDDQNTNQKPTFLSSDTNENVLSNLEVHTSVTPKVPNAADRAENLGYDSPYANLQTNPEFEAPSAQPLNSVAPQQQAASFNLGQMRNQSASASPVNPQLEQTPQNFNNQNNFQPHQPSQEYTPPAQQSQIRDNFNEATVGSIEEKPKVVYEKTIVEKGPSFLSNVFSQLFRCGGCSLLILFVIVAFVVYTINF